MAIGAALFLLGVPAVDEDLVYSEPGGRGVKFEPPINPEDIQGKSIDLDVDYEISSLSDAYKFNVCSSSGIPLEFWEAYLPPALADLSEGLVYCDEQDVNALYLYSVAVTEVGYNCEVVGDYNYFNYTVDAKHYQDFSSPLDCFEYTVNRYHNAYYDYDWQLSVPITPHDLPPVGDLIYEDDNVTITEINRRYAMFQDYTVNWKWQETVAEIMADTSEAYLAWLNQKVGGTMNVEGV